MIYWGDFEHVNNGNEAALFIQGSVPQLGENIPPVSPVSTCSTGPFHPPSRTAAAEVNKNRETLKWLLLVSAQQLLSDAVCVRGSVLLIWKQECVVEGAITPNVNTFFPMFPKTIMA